ncbi:F1N19.6 [Arabidopsis thaliana]|jgi:cell division protein FtsX|uniref:At1g64490 n=3 Tax=Arabidopsis TaxID=3701 RepID=Q9SGW6_ARATH|nr:DEK, chromatin associated protein [Arabidopsis thaliana]KAG7658410.1 DEK C-terminal [Arabidopsis suecica]AAF19669.1 F1N19.6 [Arabidopsis thaliana]AAM61420.1 unknown [Arabidopsis thaliana]ABD38913.1 At1g64490 [Arabidopsis thaliana]AEE34246.1 DEK, chromatin associated protein [Arabidopsis thaliana]|eukprot:NP_564835.1 DEK, chromatin associated protein [Arabidopsis thaliana]
MEEEEARQVVIDNDLKKKIKETVKKILKRSSLLEITEIKAREEASSELNLDLSRDPYKIIVREAVDSFIEKAIMTIDTEMGKLHTQIVEDVDGEVTENATKTTTKKKKKKKAKKKVEEEESSPA